MLFSRAANLRRRKCEKRREGNKYNEGSCERKKERTEEKQSDFLHSSGFFFFSCLFFLQNVLRLKALIYCDVCNLKTPFFCNIQTDGGGNGDVCWL
ncbi:hypothetical protein AOLI_G00282010 [Acnodon oligacanthus]